MYDLESIQAMYTGRAVEITQHFHNRIKERSIKYSDVGNVIQSGEIIEQCLDDFPNPSVLIHGNSLDGKPLHIIVGVGDDRVWLVTAYFPTLDVWEADYKTRKETDKV